MFKNLHKYTVYSLTLKPGREQSAKQLNCGQNMAALCRYPGLQDPDQLVDSNKVSTMAQKSQSKGWGECAVGYLGGCCACC